MITPFDFYTKQLDKHKQELRAINQQIGLSVTLRLVTFVLIVMAGYFAFGNATSFTLVLLLGCSVFGFLVLRHNGLLRNRFYTESLIQINTIELEVLEGKISALDSGEEFIDASHDYSYDIDLYGEGSFFQYINRTATKTGKHKLAAYLSENNINGIKDKQEVVKELSKLPEWRQHFTALANITKTSVSEDSIKNWFKVYKPFISKYLRFLPIAFSGLSLLFVVLFIIQKISFIQLAIWFSIGLTITGGFLKKINKLYLHANKAGAVFFQISELLKSIESQTFSSEALKNKSKDMMLSPNTASLIVQQFSKILDAFDQRNNMIVGFIANGFLLWDLRQCTRIEDWMSKYGEKVPVWFNIITYFDAQNSLANFVFNKPNYVFPELTSEVNVIQSEALGHPLLKPFSRIDNDYTIAQKEFFIITGANMAGKSTFLRTVSLSIVMANVGLPVCAKHFTYNPIKLITSMRTTDSLKDSESYFFSELKRLKYIVNQIQKESYFIILDEILKGTNSQDKAIGSQKFVERLVKSESTGIIATHDLSLCEISNRLPQVKNVYFDAEIIDDELHFDYQLKQGVCQNMNASFLLKKLEIV